jgi:hypothetical protein
MPLPLIAGENAAETRSAADVRRGAAAPDIGPPVTPFVTAMDRLAGRPEVRPGGVTLQAAWAASLILLGVGLAAGFVWRSEVMQHWPPSARLYGTLGLAGDTTVVAR